MIVAKAGGGGSWGGGEDEAGPLLPLRIPGSQKPTLAQSAQKKITAGTPPSHSRSGTSTYRARPWRCVACAHGACQHPPSKLPCKTSAHGATTRAIIAAGTAPSRTGQRLRYCQSRRATQTLTANTRWPVSPLDWPTPFCASKRVWMCGFTCGPGPVVGNETCVSPRAQREAPVQLAFIPCSLHATVPTAGPRKCAREDEEAISSRGVRITWPCQTRTHVLCSATPARNCAFQMTAALRH